MVTNSNNEITNILHPEMNFIEEVETCISKDCNIFDCMQQWCEDRKIEFEQIVPVINSNKIFKQKVQKAAEAGNFLKRKKSK